MRAATRIASELLRLGSLELSAASAAGARCPANQAEALRKMLLAIVTDPRLVLIKLAAQLHLLRESKDAPPAERERIALETREVYAPLANRLGVWQLKWELEDLSFRYLDPENYKRVAGWLAAKRVDRERYIDEVIAHDHAASSTKADIEAEVAGRPKHIYSIWRKMQRKGLSFDQLYDIRAVRVLVDDDRRLLRRARHRAQPVAVHSRRVRRLHRDAQGQSLSLAAHRGDRSGQAAARDPDPHARDARACRARRRRALALQGRRPRAIRPTSRRSSGCGRSSSRAIAATETEGDFLERVRSEIFEDRVYALSPRGEVIDLPRGATPLDFAYHVHTDLGHRCRGREGQRPHGAAQSAARERRSGRDRHRQAAQSEPRLAGAFARLSRLARAIAARCARGSASWTRNRTASRASRSWSASCSASRSTPSRCLS